MGIVQVLVHDSLDVRVFVLAGIHQAGTEETALDVSFLVPAYFVLQHGQFPSVVPGLDYRHAVLQSADYFVGMAGDDAVYAFDPA